MEIFVKKPILAIVMSLMILLSGIIAATKLPTSQFPQIESSSLKITTEYVGVSADVVQGFITEPIERVAMSIPGVDYVDSTTTSGRSVVTAWLKLNENSVDALAELNSRLSQIAYELPNGAQDPSVTVARVDKPAEATFYLNVESSNMDRATLTDYLEREVTPVLASITGIQSVEVAGGRKPAMRIWLDPLKMSSVNISASEVHQALTENNVIASLGSAKNEIRDISLTSNALYKSSADFRQMVIKKSADTFIYLGDIARIEQGEARGSQSARFNRNETVFLSIVTTPGSNEIAIGDALYKRLEKVAMHLPQGTDIAIAYDGTLYMRDALHEILTTLVETVILVGIVVVALMGSFRTALVPLITIPISLLGSVAAMYLAGFSLNLLTILAIVLSVGSVVDDSIVVVENVARHMRNGKSHLQAAISSSKELIGPISAMAITLASVYAPIGFVSGLSGELFKEFAFTLAIAVLLSGMAAITLSPVMSAYVIPKKGQEGRFTKKINQAFESLGERYHGILERIFKYKGAVLTAVITLSLLIVPFYILSQKELAPREDQSSLFVITEAPPGGSLAYSNQNMIEVYDAIEKLDGVDAMWQSVGADASFGGINFLPFNKRERSVQEMQPELYQTLKNISGIRIYPVMPLPLPTAGQFDVELVVQAQDSYENMVNYTYQLLDAAMRSNKFMFVDTDLKMDMPQTRFQFDNRKIADLGMTPKQVIDQISLMVSEQEVTRYDSKGKAYHVIPMLENNARPTSEAILELQIKLPQGSYIPLSSIATLEHTVSARKMGKFNQQKSFRILGGTIPGVTPNEALAHLEAAAAEILPAGYQLDYAGGSRQLRQEGNSLLSVLGVALFIVYLVLSVQFNSFRSPFVVLLGAVPLALSGALSFSFLGLTSINIYAQIGIITLVGLVAKNGILITEFADELQREGYCKAQAILEGAKIRMRPVLMTTAATVLGHFPLVLVTGPGAEARNSIGIILVAGMLIGSIFTLFVLPVVYMVIGKDWSKNRAETASSSTINKHATI